ncbi:MAG: hypothetical protein JSW33_09430 [bacterium]|nr:MAG: hypothetical protein JSW33_09430 [bacterium]
MNTTFMKFLLLFTILIMFVQQAAAGLFDDRYPSARATAMGGSGVAVANDVWASYYNPAGLSQLSRIHVGTSYLRLFNVSFLSNFFGAATYPFPGRYGTASVSFQYFGVNYQDKNLSGEYTFAFSHGFYLLKDIHSSLSLGYSFKGYHWALGESLEWGNLGSATTFGLDVGLLASIYTRTFIGVYLLNINSPQIGAYTQHDLPQRVVVGLAYRPYDGVTTSIDFNRSIGQGEMQIWGGAEFRILSRLDLRFGATTNPNRFSAGLGIHIAQFVLNYALLTHSELGESHQIGLEIEF